VIGLSFVMRIVGDAGAGTNLEILSWLSPIGLAQRVRPFATERPSVLMALMAAALVVALSAQAISRRRDVGAGLIAARSGRATASSWLGGPLGLAVRAQREVATSWLVGFALVGAMIGAVTESFVDLMLETPALAAIVAGVGGMEVVSDAFMASIFALFGVVAAAHGVQAALWLRTEELAGRAENILSTRVGRPEWMSGHVVIALVVPALDLLAGGATAGLAYGVTVGDPSQSLRLAGAALVSLPAAWLSTGVGLALFGFVPHLSRLAWSLVGIAGLLTLLGRALGLDQWVLNLSPFTHTPAVPGETLTLTPLVWMSVVAAVLIAAAYRAVQHRDVETL
jgi:ABC-2 type transport system permease protein